MYGGKMKRRILLVDDEVAVLLTLKAVLEINGFEVETAASAREARHLLVTREFHMVVTDMRMESDSAGAEVIEYALKAPSRPAIAMLTAFPVAEEDWRDLGADQMLVKPMNTHVLLQQIEQLLLSHEAKKQQAILDAAKPQKPVTKKAAAAKKVADKKSAAKKAAAKKKVPAKPKWAKAKTPKKSLSGKGRTGKARRGKKTGHR